MVSIDHFTQELLAQMRNAVAQGQTDILVTVGGLCGSILRGRVSPDACCDAMEAEIKNGDVVVLERGDLAGMTVRYLLPRASETVLR